MTLILSAALWHSQPRLVGLQVSAKRCLIYQSGWVEELILGVANADSITYQ